MSKEAKSMNSIGLRTLTAALALTFVAACAGDGTGPDGQGNGNGGGQPPPPSGNGAVTLSGEVQPIFSNNCAFSGCHGGTSPQLGQNLSEGQAFASIVGVPSVQVPSMNRVTAGDPDMSYLVHKIQGTQASVGGSGERMPLGFGALPQSEIDIIRTWITEGAANN
jgi:hypothetical protein